MDDDDALQALAYQLEQENRQQEEQKLLGSDPGYDEWLRRLEKLPDPWR
jgi:hypothetical protein